MRLCSPVHPQCDAELHSYLQEQSGPELLNNLSILPCHAQCDAELYSYLQEQSGLELLHYLFIFPLPCAVRP